MQFPAIPEDDAFIWPKAKASESVQDRVYRHLAYLLMCGFFRPGETISLRQLSSALDVSETPVRNALNRLVAESALDVLPNRHVCIPTLTREQFDELTQLRTALETDITAHAFHRAKKSDIKDLEEINRSLLEAIRERRIQKCIALNQRFHLTLYELADRPLTFGLITSLWLRAGTFMYATLRSDDVKWRTHQHVALIKGLKNKDVDACVKAIANDIADTHAEITKLPHEFVFRVSRAA